MRSFEFENALNKIPRLDLAAVKPTPLYRLAKLEKEWGYPQIYIKRDDLTGLGQGGNKVRCLEYLLADAEKQGADMIIAGGGSQSNLCSLTAAACALTGFPCELVMNDAEPKRTEGNLLLDRLCGAQVRHIGPVSFQERNACMEELAEKYRLSGRRPYVIRNGASTGMGALGYAKAAAEIAGQCRGMDIGRLSLFCPGGNGGVAAGLIYGNAMMGSPLDIIVISVEDEKDVLEEHIRGIISEEEQIVGMKPAPGEDYEYIISDSCTGGGWGIDSRESLEMVRSFASTQGLFVEKVYTSKVLVGMKDMLTGGAIKGPACFLHTGGLASLFAQF